MAKHYNITINKGESLSLFKTICGVRSIVGSISNIDNEKGIQVEFTDFDGEFNLKTVANVETMFVQFFFDYYELKNIDRVGDDNKQSN